jgi:hypothetical protein
MAITTKSSIRVKARIRFGGFIRHPKIGQQGQNTTRLVVAISDGGVPGELDSFAKPDRPEKTSLPALLTAGISPLELSQGNKQLTT